MASGGQLPKLLARDSINEAKNVQVAAVCYRQEAGSVRFLLVRTTSGRWTFPKGRLEDDLLPAQVAALEALEEGGVVGKVDPRPFGQYLHSKESLRGPKELIVFAFLLEVEKSAEPAETHRSPQWFTPIEAKRRLLRHRSRKYLSSINRVFDSALLEIAHRQSQLSPD